VQSTITGSVALAAIVVQSLQEGRQLVEVFQPLNVRLRNLTTFPPAGTFLSRLLLAAGRFFLAPGWSLHKAELLFPLLGPLQSPLTLPALFFCQGFSLTHQCRIAAIYASARDTIRRFAGGFFRLGP